MSERGADPEIGVAMRYMCHCDIASERIVFTMMDDVCALAAADDREDVPFSEKLADALAYIKSRLAIAREGLA